MTLVLFDFIFILFSLLFATFLRFDFSIPSNFIVSKFQFFLLYSLIITMTFFSLGEYEEKWEYSSLREYLKTSLTFASVNLFLGIFFYFSEGFFIPRTIFFISLPISLLLIISIRIFQRGIKEFSSYQNNDTKIAIVCKEKNLLNIYEKLNTYNVVAIFFVEKIPKGRMFKGIPVYYDISYLKNLPVNEIFVDKEINQDLLIKIIENKNSGAIIRKIDASSHLYIEDFRIEDVIKREKRVIEVEIDKEKVYLITGAGGSIGKSIVKELVNLGAKYLKLLDYSEENIHNLKLELLPFENIKKEFILCDIKDDCISKIVGNVDIIFHCAANKHVPYVEENKYTAYKTNIIGLINVLENFKSKDREFVFISTDKAVNPINFMGITKRIGELITLAYQEDYSKSIVVRFGNVFGTSGSLIPSVIKQIKMYNKVFLTDKNVKRFFMLPEESAKLIIKSLTIPNSKIAVLDMGEQLEIYELVKKIIELVAKNRKVEIEIIGLRKGEKLEEELFFEFEKIIEKQDYIFIVEPNVNVSKNQILNLIDQVNQELKNMQNLQDIEEYLNQKLKSILIELNPIINEDLEKD